MNYTELFYWLTVADNVKLFTGIAAIVFGLYFIASVAAALGLFEQSWSTWQRSSKVIFTIFSLVFFFNSFIWLFTPNKKDALLIVAGGSTMNFLTTDSTAKQLSHELSSYLVTEIRNMAEETKVELSINDNKQKILEEAKQLTGEELIEKLQSDTILRNIILK